MLTVVKCSAEITNNLLDAISVESFAYGLMALGMRVSWRYSGGEAHGFAVSEVVDEREHTKVARVTFGGHRDLKHACLLALAGQNQRWPGVNFEHALKVTNIIGTWDLARYFLMVESVRRLLELKPSNWTLRTRLGTMRKEEKYLYGFFSGHQNSGSGSRRLDELEGMHGVYIGCCLDLPELDEADLPAGVPENPEKFVPNIPGKVRVAYYDAGLPVKLLTHSTQWYDSLAGWKDKPGSLSMVDLFWLSIDTYTLLHELADNFFKTTGRTSWAKELGLLKRYGEVTKL